MTKLPSFHFEMALCQRRSEPSFSSRRIVREWMVIGRIEGGPPFMLEYYGLGYTRWECPETLGNGLRKKILGGLREQLRYAEKLPDYVSFHDLVEADIADWEASGNHSFSLRSAFRKTWLETYLGIVEVPMIDLKVPFEDREAAKAAGATWHRGKRVWQIAETQVSPAIAQWLPTEHASPSAPH